jgi:hypothetical protein
MRATGTALHAFLLLVASLVLGSLLNAHGLRRTALVQPPGVRRDVALALTRPLVQVSDTLYLDRPRSELKAALGRSADDRVDTTIALPLVHAVRPPHRVAHHRRPAVKTKRTPFTSARPLRVWVAGDSLAQVPGEALERKAGSGGALDIVGLESRLDTGLTRPDLFNWFTRLPQVVSQLKPRAAVLFFGADDEHSYMSGVPSGETLGPLGSASWDAEYRRRVDAVTQELVDSGAYVVWVGLPITRGDGYRLGFRTVNHILRAAVAAEPGKATYLDTWRLFVDSQGKYADYLPNAHGRLQLMRAPDGVHYEPAAGDVIAERVLARLHTVFDLR